jgi:SM-20-related protein
MIDFSPLLGRDWLVVDTALPEVIRRRWLALGKARHAEGGFRAAGIGRDTELQVDRSIRSDEIYWLQDWAENPVEQEMLRYLGELKSALNRQLMLGATAVEAHLARYDHSGHYQCHEDNARGINRRQISAIFYLHDEWRSGDGGELVISPRKNYEVIEPLPGRAAFFVSDGTEHEVRATWFVRWSLTSWFLR